MRLRRRFLDRRQYIATQNSIWRSQNGTDGYLMGDYNLSGGVTAYDANAFGRVNNGKISQVP